MSLSPRSLGFCHKDWKAAVTEIWQAAYDKLDVQLKACLKSILRKVRTVPIIITIFSRKQSCSGFEEA